MSQVDYQALKKGGFMRQIQKERFSLRLRVAGGQIEANQIAKVSEIAEKYGHGYVHLTSRQGLEIPFISLKDIDDVKKELSVVGLQPGSCGPRVRTVTACQGISICPSGLIETSDLSKEIDEKYFGLELPHKFKIGITGCKNNCLKAEENDIGIKGGLLPIWEQSDCTYCGLCEVVCPVKVINVDKSAKSLAIDEDGCIYCGKCVKACPTNSWKGKNGYILSFGGMFGTRIRKGEEAIPILFEKDKLFDVIDATLEFFKEHGRASERFALTIERVGFDVLKEKLKEVL
ncbi:MAG: nitrite/sulfite reductase, 4Fe-4S iron-sulfur cluster-binding domain protein [Oscillospiraceae bacterium]|jgi:dissimilatory sulfite reductase (desulfoviridin) alpha/beta subunit|nr:nitrite/sulfite reductase, 4Fe-4S iron-sulfur cluster-binding domain protein [Oscillospiraceae bacterium]